MVRSLTEQKVLKKLGIDDFRHLTKDKVITMASMLDRMDPEVAKKAIEQANTADEIKNAQDDGITNINNVKVPSLEDAKTAAKQVVDNALTKKLSFPALALIVSGGHTNLVYMKDNYKFEILGGTLDDAIGEAFDKVARVLDLKYPGGPNIEKLAKNGKTTYKLPIPMNNQSMDFSFSGLKSGIINLVHNEIQRGNEINKEDLACSFQNIAVDEVVRKLEIAINKTKVSNVIVAGGVSANTYLRDKITELTKKYNINLGIPDLKYCTDNAAMIGAAAYYLYLKKDFSDLNLQPQPNKSLN